MIAALCFGWLNQSLLRYYGSLSKEKSLQETIAKLPAEVNEFHVAPMVNPENELPYHEWFVEFENDVENIDGFSNKLNLNLQNLNSYYKDLITGNVLQSLKITKLRKGSFREYMKSVGKLGGQNKIPRLANDRKIADELSNYKINE